MPKRMVKINLKNGQIFQQNDQRHLTLDKPSILQTHNQQDKDYQKQTQEFQNLLNLSKLHVGQRVYIVSLRWLKRWYLYDTFKNNIKEQSLIAQSEVMATWVFNEDILRHFQQNLIKFHPKTKQVENQSFYKNLDGYKNSDLIFLFEDIWNYFSGLHQQNIIATTLTTETYHKLSLILINQEILKNSKSDIKFIKSRQFVISGQLSIQNVTYCLEKLLDTQKIRLSLINSNELITLDQVQNQVQSQLVNQKGLSFYQISLQNTVQLDNEKFIQDYRFKEGDHIIIDENLGNDIYSVSINKNDIQRSCLEYGQFHEAQEIQALPQYSMAPKLESQNGDTVLGQTQVIKSNTLGQDLQMNKSQQEDKKFSKEKITTTKDTVCNDWNPRIDIGNVQKYSVKESSSSQWNTKNNKRTPPKIDGRCGLRNLGNTCYMNSSIQCLSNTEGLADYFLQDLHKYDINRENKLGYNGFFAEAFAKLLKSIWLQNEYSSSPHEFKSLLAQQIPMYQGYQQHDSFEFLLYLLDILHEDLNRVQNKPQVYWSESNEQDQNILAKEHWKYHHQRNQSIIMDLFCGQQKHIIQCSQCNHTTINYESYLTIQLPLAPQNQMQYLTFYLLIDQQMTRQEISFEDNQCFKDLVQMIQQKLNADKLIFDFGDNSSDRQYLLEDSQELQILKQKLTHSKLLVRRLSDIERTIPSNESIGVLVTFPYYNRDQIPPRSFIMSTSFTFCDIHQLIYNELGKIFYNLNRIFDEKYYYQEVLNRQYKLLLKIQSGNNRQECYLCKKQYCNDCFLPLSHQKFDFDLTKKLIDKNLRLEFQIYLLHLPKVRLSDNHEESKNSHNIDLQDCFKYYEEQVTIEKVISKKNSGWQCPSCNDHVKAIQTQRIYSAPQQLILQLKRFKKNMYNEQIKSNTFVKYPLLLDMSRYVINPRQPIFYDNPIQSESLIYELYAVINHSGSLNGGHYTSYAKNKTDGKFYKYDDSVVSQIDDVVSDNAYVLFYQRKL